jgi:nickel/cobalt transporter (NicO) family protein
MLQIIIGSSLLSFFHALIPHHWLPLALAGKSEKWSVKETIRITLLIGLMHTFSTIIIGIVIGIIGYKLTDLFQSFENLLAPSILIGLGLFFLVNNFISKDKHEHDEHHHHEPEEHHHHDVHNNGEQNHEHNENHEHHCNHHHDHTTHHHLSEEEIKFLSRKSKRTVISAIGTMMVFSPCIEIEAFYFTAGKYGWTGIALLSLIYFIITIVVMLSCVLLAKKGLDYINKKLHFFEHYSKAIAGSVLIILGLLSVFVQF